jgi:uncharacterized protein with HEPN domain
MRDDKERLRDILEAIAQIEKYAVLGQAEFQQNELIQVWIVHHLQIIGEASNSLSQKLITKYPRVPWAEIVAFRNILVHEYFRVDLKAVWKIIERDLSDLKNQVEDILEDEQQ